MELKDQLNDAIKQWKDCIEAINCYCRFECTITSDDPRCSQCPLREHNTLGENNK